jgi:hypothetical protein
VDEKTCLNKIFIYVRTIRDEDVYSKEDDEHIHEEEKDGIMNCNGLLGDIILIENERNKGEDPPSPP